MNEKLVNAFLNQNYRECKELIKNGADSNEIIKQAKRIGGQRLTLTQDMIIRELT